MSSAGFARKSGQAYAAVLTAASDLQLNGNRAEATRMLTATSAVELEGPPEVAVAALELGRAVSASHNDPSVGLDDVMAARTAYVQAIRRALEEA